MDRLLTQFPDNREKLMDQEIEQMVISVRADTAAFARDVSAMRGELEGPLVQGAGRAGPADRLCAVASDHQRQDRLRRTQEGRARGHGGHRLGFASGTVSAGGGGGVGAGLISGLSNLVAGLVGSPGRATGGPVSGGRAYHGRGARPGIVRAVGERTDRSGRGRPRDVRVAISVVAPPGASEPQALRQSSRQIARAVRSAIRKGDAMNYWFTQRDAPIVTTWVKCFDPLHWTVDFPLGNSCQLGHHVRWPWARRRGGVPTQGRPCRADLRERRRQFAPGACARDRARLFEDEARVPLAVDWRHPARPGERADSDDRGPGLRTGMPADLVRATVELRRRDGRRRDRSRIDFDALDGGYSLPTDADRVDPRDIDRMFISIVPPDYVEGSRKLARLPLP